MPSSIEMFSTPKIPRLEKGNLGNVEFEGVLTNPDHWPIQIRNGVISIDFGSGCLKCAFCITKRQPGRSKIQDMPYMGHLSADKMLGLLSQTQAFTEAKLPLRIGNNTDGTLISVPVLEKFLNGLPEGYPAALLTRGVMSDDLLSLLSKYDNVVLCRTITIPHQSLGYSFNLSSGLEGFLDAECKKVLNIGPVIQETLKETAELLLSGRIPRGTKVIIAPLNIKKMPNAVIMGILGSPITNQQLKQLEQLAIENGYEVHRANNCSIAALLGMPSIEYGDINYYLPTDYSSTNGTSNHRNIDPNCNQCSNQQVCEPHNQKEIPNLEDSLANVAYKLGLPVPKVIWKRPGIIVIECTGITKSETSYLTGMLGIRVTAANSLAQPDEKAMKRWVNKGFYPVEQMIKVSQPFDRLDD